MRKYTLILVVLKAVWEAVLVILCCFLPRDFSGQFL